MGCLLVLVAFLAPRVTMFFIWVLTDWFDKAYQTSIVPLLGFLFLPYTTLVYLAAMLHAGGLHGWWLPLVVLAVLADLGHGRGGIRVYRRRKRGR